MANLISQELCNLSFYAHLMVRKAAYQTADSDQHCIKSLCVRYLLIRKAAHTGDDMFVSTSLQQLDFMSITTPCCTCSSSPSHSSAVFISGS